MINSEEQYTDYMENPIDIADISTIKLRSGKPENEIADLASDLVYGQVPNGEGTGLEGIPAISINSYPKDGSREHNLLHTYYKMYKSKKDQTEFENTPLEVVNTWDPEKQQRWFTAQMNRGAKTVLPAVLGAATLPWTIYGAMAAPLATVLSIGGGLLGSKIGGDYGRKIDIRRHGYTNYGDLYGTVGGLFGGALGGFTGNTTQAFLPKARLTHPSSRLYGGYENHFSNNPTPESTFGRVLQKVVHPKEQAYYHGSPDKFPIKKFNTGTPYDIGLHVALDTKIPQQMAGPKGHVYKLYAPKPKGHIMDSGSNGISAIYGNKTYKPGQLGPSSFRVPNDMTKVFEKYGGDNVKFTPNDLYTSMTVSDAIVVPIHEVNNLNLSAPAKTRLSGLRNDFHNLRQIPEAERFMSMKSINSKAAQTLYEDGFPVIGYTNLYENPGTFSALITSPKAIRLPINEKFNFGSLLVPGIQTSTWNHYNK